MIIKFDYIFQRMIEVIILVYLKITCINLSLAEARGRLVSEPQTLTLKAYTRANLQLLSYFSSVCLE